LTPLTDGTCRNGGIGPLIRNVPVCAMALVAGRRPPTKERPVHFQANQCEIGGRQSCTETGFCWEIQFPASI